MDKIVRATLLFIFWLVLWYLLPWGEFWFLFCLYNKVWSFITCDILAKHAHLNRVHRMFDIKISHRRWLRAVLEASDSWFHRRISIWGDSADESNLSPKSRNYISSANQRLKCCCRWHLLHAMPFTTQCHRQIGLWGEGADETHSLRIIHPRRFIGSLKFEKSLPMTTTPRQSFDTIFHR